MDVKNAYIFRTKIIVVLYHDISWYYTTIYRVFFVPNNSRYIVIYHDISCFFTTIYRGFTRRYIVVYRNIFWQNTTIYRGLPWYIVVKYRGIPRVIRAEKPGIYHDILPRYIVVFFLMGIYIYSCKCEFYRYIQLYIRSSFTRWYRFKPFTKNEQTHKVKNIMYTSFIITWKNKQTLRRLRIKYDSKP